MNDTLIMAGIALASAGVGFFVRSKMDHLTINLLKDISADRRERFHDLADRQVRALQHIPPYTRGANGSLRKIGKILRGEEG